MFAIGQRLKAQSFYMHPVNHGGIQGIQRDPGYVYPASCSTAQALGQSVCMYTADLCHRRTGGTICWIVSTMSEAGPYQGCELSSVRKRTEIYILRAAESIPNHRQVFIPGSCLNDLLYLFPALISANHPPQPLSIRLAAPTVSLWAV